MYYHSTMSIAESKVTAQGQISVPAKVRKKLGLAPGSILEWHEQEGEIFVRRASMYTSQEVHNAIFSEKPRARSLADMNEGIRNRMRRKHERH